MQQTLSAGRGTVAAILVLIIPLFLGMFTAPPLMAQGAVGILLGVITDEGGGEVISGAVVQLRNTSSGEVLKSAPADEMGMYTLRDIPMGTYDLAVETEQGFFLTTEQVVISREVPLVLSIALQEDAAAGAAVKSASFWKTPLGIAVITASAVAGGFALAEAFATDEQPPESPNNP